MSVRLDPCLFTFLPMGWHSYLYHLYIGAQGAHQSALYVLLQPSEVEYIAIKSVPNWKTSVSGLISIHEHGSKYHDGQ